MKIQKKSKNFMEISERVNLLDFLEINNLDNSFDLSCPFLDDRKKVCSIRPISRIDGIFWYCSHADMNGCPHYNWEVLGNK